jgi:anti-sigma B factor antagonist
MSSAANPDSGNKSSAGAGKFVRIDKTGDAVVVSPLFTFASFTEADLAAEWKVVQHEIDAAGVKHVIVDLGEIPYFGSTVLEWMVQMWKQAKAKGGSLATCNCSKIGREVLHATRFDTLWGVFETRDEALKSVGETPA